MKLYRKLIVLFLLLVIVVCTGIGIWKIYQYRSYYIPIASSEKQRIESIISGNIGDTPDLNTYQALVSWIPEALTDQTEMMDQVLPSLKILGEARNGKPARYIKAQYSDMAIYIPYDYKEKTPASKIVLEAESHFYLVSAEEEYVDAVVDYMRSQISFGPSSD